MHLLASNRRVFFSGIFVRNPEVLHHFIAPGGRTLPADIAVGRGRAALGRPAVVEALREVLDYSDPDCHPTGAAVDSDRALLDLAVSLGCADIVQVLLEYGVDADKPSRGRTPFETAAASGECLIVELLLANGATPAGSDALHAAAAASHSDILRLLLAKPRRRP